MKQFAPFLIVALCATVAFAAAGKKSSKKTPDVTITGYLVDNHCAKALMAKNDVAMPAKQHLRADDLAPEGVSSGYGVFVVVNKTATHASDVDFYRLNAAGNKAAKEMLEKSKKKDDILVTVTGKATIEVENISEAK